MSAPCWTQDQTKRWLELAHGHAGTKQQLHQMYEARQVIQFAEFYPVGHRSTDYPKFFNCSAPYAVKFKTGYEPYILVSRRAMPWYDERFRGYGWDKVRRPSMPQDLENVQKYQQSACPHASHSFSAAAPPTPCCHLTSSEHPCSCCLVNGPEHSLHVQLQLILAASTIKRSVDEVLP